MSATVSLPWLHAPLTSVIERLTQGRLPHALLVCGPAGWGQEALAAAITARLLGLEAGRSIDALAHPDLRQIEPDGAVLKVEQVRAIGEFAVGTRQSAPAKVALVHRAHALNVQAANALLKTLEEPSADTYLLLVTDYPGRLLPTIRSRCQKVIVRPDAAAADAWLREQCADSDHLDTLMFEFGGAPLAVRDAVAAQLAPIGPVLSNALRSGDHQLLYAALLEADADTVLLRALRYLLATQARSQQALKGLGSTSARALDTMARELMFTHRGLLQSNSVNVSLQMERLAQRFVALAQGL